MREVVSVARARGRTTQKAEPISCRLARGMVLVAEAQQLKAKIMLKGEFLQDEFLERQGSG